MTERDNNFNVSLLHKTPYWEIVWRLCSQKRETTGETGTFFKLGVLDITNNPE